MILPDQIVRTDRKTLSLSIKKDGQIIIHAPNKMKQEVINKFVEDKQHWLSTKLALLRSNQDKYSDVLDKTKYSIVKLFPPFIDS